MQEFDGNNNLNMFHIMENISDGCFFLNSEWEYTFINKAAAEFMNNGVTSESFLGKKICSLFPEYHDSYESQKIIEAFKEQKTLEFETLSKYSKKWLEVKVYPEPEGVFVLFSDLPEKKRREKQKEYYEKLKVMGEMSAGVAHEVRNPLASVKGFLQLMAENKKLIQYKDIYNLMIDEINRVNGIITEFLETAKNKPSQKEVCNLNEIIETLLPLLETRAIQEDKSIILELNTIPNLKIDPNEIRQLLLNMVNNSLDAMEPGRRVSIFTYERKKEVIMTIQDEGQGIPDHLINEIPNPFVTTKETGTGLGLPICFSIAERNNAHIDYSSDGNGTTFNVCFTYGKE
ncbi:two-component system sensor histidine kinase NtrB [Bacillus sp. AK031]